MYRVIFLTVIIVFVSANFHPIHVSVCEMEHNETGFSIEVTHRIFLDDLEKELGRETKLEHLRLNNKQKEWIHMQLKAYFERHFRLSLNGSEKQATYLGFEFEHDVIYVYLEYEKVYRLNNVKVFNDILLKTYDDQVNLLHFKKGKTTKSIRFDHETSEGQIEFNQQN